MAFLDELESDIRATYAKLLQKKNAAGKGVKTLNCDSFCKITENIKSIMVNTNRNGETVLETANQIIFKLLQSKYFIYGNCEMSALIGYLYLRKMKVTINHYTINGIADNSTIDEIRCLTEKW